MFYKNLENIIQLLVAMMCQVFVIFFNVWDMNGWESFYIFDILISILF